jgi:hypothetical protein
MPEEAEADCARPTGGDKTSLSKAVLNNRPLIEVAPFKLESVSFLVDTASFYSFSYDASDRYLAMSVTY